MFTIFKHILNEFKFKELYACVRESEVSEWATSRSEKEAFKVPYFHFGTKEIPHVKMPIIIQVSNPFEQLNIQ